MNALFLSSPWPRFFDTGSPQPSHKFLPWGGGAYCRMFLLSLPESSEPAWSPALPPQEASEPGACSELGLSAGGEGGGVPSSGQLAKFREEGSRARLCLWRHSSAFTSVFSHFFFLAFCSLKYLDFKNSSCWRQFLEGRESSIFNPVLWVHLMVSWSSTLVICVLCVCVCVCYSWQQEWRFCDLLGEEHPLICYQERTKEGDTRRGWSVLTDRKTEDPKWKWGPTSILL